MTLGADRLKIETVQPQIVIILKIVYRGDVMRILEPSDVVRARVLADQKLMRDFGEGGSARAMSAGAVLRAVLPPIFHVVI